MSTTSRSDLRSLIRPHVQSHKWQNGSVLVIGGSHRYHGAPLLAVSAAARFVDIVHFACEENYKNILPRMRGKLFEFIPVFSRELPTYIHHVDVVLMGPGLELNDRNKNLVRSIQKRFPHKRMVIDAGAFRLADLKLINENSILTPNKNEYMDVFHSTQTPTNVARLSRSLHCTIVAKGPKTYIAHNGVCATNNTGNAGLTKGGTGDILAGLTAAFFCKNDAFKSAKAASFLLGKTAETLWKKRSFAFSASDVLAGIPEIFGKMLKP